MRSWDDAFWHFWLTNSVEEAERLANNWYELVMRKGPFNPNFKEEFEDNRNRMHAARIREAFELLRSYMHDAEGSNGPGPMEDHIWSARRIQSAAVQLEIAEMLIFKELDQI